MSSGQVDPVLVPFGWPVVIYMTLAGLAAGAALTGCWLLWRGSEGGLRAARRGFLLAASAILVGSLCLVADLEAPGRFWMVLAYFNPASWIAWGARIIVLFGLLTGLAWVLSRGAAAASRLSPGLKTCCAGIACLAVAIGLYPAWVLMQAAARPLWGSPLIAPLFLASALHTGLAALLASQVIAGAGDDDPAPGGARFERSLIVAQALFLGLYLLTLASGYEAARARLLYGDLALWLWGGVVVVGWLVPLATTGGRWSGSGRLLLRAACVLLGGLALRVLIVFGGQGAQALIGAPG